MDLEILEAIALSDDRSAALAQLLPGSEDHDYFRCLAALHAGAEGEAAQILDAWPGRHGRTQRFDGLTLRANLYAIARSPDGAPATQIRDYLGVSHWHEPEVAAVDPTRPTRLDPAQFDAARLLQQAVDYDTNLSQVTDEGLGELVAQRAPLDDSRRRSLLSRIAHAPGTYVVELAAAELAVRGQQFGNQAAHAQLTLAQLEQLATLRPELRGNLLWINAAVMRLRPIAAIDLDSDLAARAAYLEHLWAFVAGLAPVAASLKAHVLYHLLDTARRMGPGVDAPRFLTYLAMPRSVGYTPRGFLDKVRGEHVAQLGTDYTGTTGLASIHDDEALVRDLIARSQDRAADYAPFFEIGWFERELATLRLLAGAPDADRATVTLGAEAAARLRDRVELDWVAYAPARFAAHEEVVLEADVKNVAELVVKVFRVDPIAYFQHHRREVSTDLDLDGLAASHEETLALPEPPVRRVRRRFALPACARPGTYVVDLIGNGKSSRAVIYKGKLRFVARTGAAGHAVTIVDEAGAPLPAARAWIGDREYVPDAHGRFVVPFSTSPGRVPMLLVAGDTATVTALDLEAETYALRLDAVLERESIAAGRTAKVVARIALACAGQPASLALLEGASWDATLVDRAGVATTRSQPLVLGDAQILEVPIGEDTASVAIVVRGRVRALSTQQDVALESRAGCAVGGIHGTLATEALYLAETAGGFVIYALGKTGEPRAMRPVTVSLGHADTNLWVNVELATDAAGRIELGALPRCTRITATLGGRSQTWDRELRDGARWLCAAPGAEIRVPLPLAREAAASIARCSLVELRQGVPHSHPAVTLEALAGAIAIPGLPPGDFELRTPWNRVRILVAETGTEVSTTGPSPASSTSAAPAASSTSAAAVAIVAEASIYTLTRQPPAIAALAATATDVELAVRGATPRTRVHVLGARFASSLAQLPDLGLRGGSPGARRGDATKGAHYLSGRELGDEYRYVLERRAHKRYPGSLLERPSLLLNPWARRTTTTDVAVAAAGGEFARAAQARGGGYGGLHMEPQAQGNADAGYIAYDFLPAAPAVLCDLPLAADGTLRIPRASLGTATTVTFLVDDPAGASRRTVALPEQPLAPRDLRLQIALDPARHATQQKTIAPLRAGETLEIADLATAQVHLVDSLERAHGYLLALRDDDTLREFAFVTRWHAAPDAERRELYAKYACHELHLFLYFKDRAFFDAAIKAALAHKRVKTFVDDFLLDTDLTAYLEPAARERLNAVELALLAHRLAAGDQLARVLGDRVAIQPPDPERDTRLIDALLGGASLDGDDRIAAATTGARDMRTRDDSPMPAMELALGAASMGGFGPPAGAPMPASAPAPMPRRAREAAKSKKMSRAMMAEEADVSADEKSTERGYFGGDGDDGLALDRARRDENRPMFRATDKTQELAEHNWWHRRPTESIASMIEPTRLWRELSVARPLGSQILTPALGLAVASFAEAMCALAIVDLPFVPAAHAIVADGPRLAITAGGNALAGTSQLVYGELVGGGQPLVVGQNYARTDDRYDYASGEQVEKYITGALAAGVVYTCAVVLANPTSARQRIAALLQIPRGSLPVGGAKATTTIEVVLEPYGTHGHEYAFYFPAPGTYSHFPVHVTRGGAIVAAAPARALEVVAGGEVLDPASWAHVSQHGSIEDVVRYLDAANLAATDLARCAWRAKDRAAYAAIVGALERRQVYADELWGYALLHGDAPRVRVFLRVHGEQLTAAAGSVIEPLALDAEAHGAYEHLEYAPLVNARAHRLGAKLRILNDGFSEQYAKFLMHVVHRAKASAEDLLAAAAYFLAQDRFGAAEAAMARVDAAGVADRMQLDYLAAYLAIVLGDPLRARALASRWTALPTERWRKRFAAMIAMLDELGASPGAPVITDDQSREQRQAEAAAHQPTFDLAVDRDGVSIHSQHVAALELRYFEMDVELLFSRQPFVASDVSRFSFIEPGHRTQVAPSGPEERIAWLPDLRGKNVVVEGVGAGMRRAKVHYANDLATTLANQFGQIRVARASDRAALPATYVKVYARKHGGEVAFYKDGYTDLRGWFDYASLSTTDLDNVEKFAILVHSDAAGAAILEAAPPAR